MQLSGTGESRALWGNELSACCGFRLQDREWRVVTFSTSSQEKPSTDKGLGWLIQAFPTYDKKEIHWQQ
jgi:hypothetical protein